jgi:hypothetical protein
MTIGGGQAFRFGIFISALIISSAFAAVAVGGVAQALNVQDPKYANPPDQAKAQLWGDDFCSYWDKNGGGYVGDMVWITARDGSKDIYAYQGDTTAPILVNAGGKYCGAHNSLIQVYGHYYDDLGTITNNNVNRTPKIAYPKQKAGTYFHAEKKSSINISSLGAGDHTLCITLDTVYGGLSPQPSPNACSPITLHILEKWTINGQSYIRKSTSINNSQGTIRNIAPGTRLYWSHDLRASAVMDRDISYRIDKSGFSNGWDAIKAPSASVKYTSGDTLFVKIYAPTGSYTVYDVTQADVGNTLCQVISWTPRSWNQGGRWPATPSACAEVPYNFNLTPSIDPLGREFGDQGGTVPTVSGKITNGGPTKSYIGVKWQLSRVVVRPGGSIEEGRQIDDTKDGCAYYANDCTPIDGQGSGEGDSSFGVKATVVRQLLNEQIGDLDVGSKVCYGMSVKAYKPGLTNASPNWRHSPAECVIIGKKPKVQVWGGDLSVGRRFVGDVSAAPGSNVEVSKSVKDNGTKTFGSWVEYGVFAPGTIDGAGSAAGLAGQNGNSSSNQVDWSKLTFANGGHTPVSGCNGTVRFGCFTKPGGGGAIPDVAARLAPKATTSNPQLTGSVSLDALKGTYYANGNLTINGSTVGKSNSVIIKARGTVFIDGDIKYNTSGSLHSLSEIPQVVILANNIQIKDTVTNVDAWLIANGASGGLYTCGPFKAVLTSKICDKPLTINGPVMAKRLFLQRTAGSGTGPASNEPAEILNLRADAYLWAIDQAGGQGSIRTLKTDELAPRF